jgi:ligand-binding sensor protein
MVGLLDLVETDTLKRLQERFSALLGFNVAFAGLNFTTVGYPEGDRAYIEGTTCAMMRSTLEGKKRCKKFDAEAGKIAMDTERPVLYRCQSFCSNFVIPIKLGREVIGFLYSGQFFARKPGEKSDREWKSLKVQKDISKQDWPDEKEKITKEEEDAWEALVREESFFHQTVKGTDVQANFFHERNGSPTMMSLGR